MARSTTAWVSAGAAGLGLVVGATLGLFVGGGGATAVNAARTTTSSATTTTTVSPATDPTTLPVADPTVSSFAATPPEVACGSDQLRARVVLTWSTDATQTVSIDADGTSVGDSLGPSGRLPLVFTCPSAGNDEQHQLELTATGTNGATATDAATVVVTGALSARNTNRGRAPSDQQGGGK